ncbi:MAG TPA: hypothetical protein VFG10_03800 [Saprospiraceae bacterium]|nr:hypothetical protein [Saprospiraceae bacterium]
MKEFILVLIAFSSLSMLRGQDTIKELEYIINPTLKDSIDKYSNTEGNEYYGKFEINLYGNDEVIFSTSDLPKAPFGLNRAILYNDKLSLQGTYGIIGIGYELRIDGSNSRLEFLCSFPESVLKMNLSDTLTNELKMNIISPQVIFTKQPEFALKEEITGIVQFITPEFYVFEGEEHQKCKYEVKSYFKSKVISRTSR